MIKIPVSVGEVWDKLSILEIKESEIKDDFKLELIRQEIDELEAALPPFTTYKNDADYLDLLHYNKLIWIGIARSQEWNDKRPEDVDFALRVYAQLNKDNNERFKIKNNINMRFGSYIKEVKSHV